MSFACFFGFQYSLRLLACHFDLYRIGCMFGADLITLASKGLAIACSHVFAAFF